MAILQNIRTGIKYYEPQLTIFKTYTVTQESVPFHIIIIILYYCHG